MLLLYLGVRRPLSLTQASATASSAVSPIQHPRQPGRPFIHIAVSPSASVYVFASCATIFPFPHGNSCSTYVPTPVSPPPVCPHLHAPHFAFSYFTTTHLIIRPSLILRTIQHRNRSVSLFTSSNDRNHDPFSSQLSRLHWWYSAGLFPTGVFAIFSGSLLVPAFAPPLVVQCRAFPHRGFCNFQWFFVGPE